MKRRQFGRLLAGATMLSGPCNSAEIVFATRNWDDMAFLAQGNVWRYTTADLSDASLRLGSHGITAGGGTRLQRLVEFKWSDANSGRQSSESQALNRPFYSAPFTRLD